MIHSERKRSRMSGKKEPGNRKAYSLQDNLSGLKCKAIIWSVGLTCTIWLDYRQLHLSLIVVFALMDSSIQVDLTCWLECTSRKSCSWFWNWSTWRAWWWGWGCLCLWSVFQISINDSIEYVLQSLCNVYIPGALLAGPTCQTVNRS